MIVVITINPLLYKHNNREGRGEFGGRIASGVARPHCNEGCAQVPPSIIIMFIINIMVMVNVVDTCLYLWSWWQRLWKWTYLVLDDHLFTGFLPTMLSGAATRCVNRFVFFPIERQDCPLGEQSCFWPQLKLYPFISERSPWSWWSPDRSLLGSRRCLCGGGKSKGDALGFPCLQVIRIILVVAGRLK